MTKPTGRGSTIRTFIGVGVEPNDELTSLLAQLGAAGPDVRAQSPEKLHITLRFLGDVEASIVPALRSVVQQTATQFTQRSIQLVSVDAFPSPSTPPSSGSVFPLPNN